MTKEGRLQRGKDNYERGRFLDNPETLAYMASLPSSKPPHKKETPKDAKSESR